MVLRILAFLALAASILAVGCTSSSADIGPAGGTVSIGSATLTVPPGALQETVEIRLAETSRDDSKWPQYEILPKTLAFDVPATLALDEPGLADDERPAFEFRRSLFGFAEIDQKSCESGRVCAEIPGAGDARVVGVEVPSGGDATAAAILLVLLLAGL